MPRFFGKIRHMLLAQNKFTRYLVYAIGEIVLVVIGILIALQINNWNEQQITNQTLKYKLNLLVKSLNNDHDDLIVLKEQTRFKIYSLQHLLKLTGKQPVSFQNHIVDRFFVLPFKENPAFWRGPYPDTINKKFIDKAFLESGRSYPEVMNTVAFDDIKSSGLLALIENDSLNKTLIKYYNEFELEFHQKYMQVLNNWRNEFINQGEVYYNAESIEDPLSLITDVPRFEASMKEVIYESVWICHLIEQRLNLIDEFLINEIENEIMKLN